MAFLLGSKGGEGDEKGKEDGRGLSSSGSSRSRRMRSSRPGRRRPPPACAAASRPMPPPAPSKKNSGEEFRVLLHCRRAGRRPNIVLGRDGGGRWLGGAPSTVWQAPCAALGHACPDRGEGGAARPKTPPSVSLVPMVPIFGRAGPLSKGGPKVSGPQGGSRPRSFSRTHTDAGRHKQSLFGPLYLLEGRSRLVVSG
jgi:hypothetical protein